VSVNVIISDRMLKVDTVRIPELDGLRGTAVLLVLIFHFAPGMPSFAPGSVGAYFISPFVRLGWTGVDLFFVLSGYLICNILLSIRESAVGLWTFFARRAARTMPLYLVLLCLFTVGVYAKSCGLLDLPHMFGKSDLLWSYFVLMQNNAIAISGGDQINFLSPSWSLAIEEQFYVAFPVLIWGLPKARLMLALWSLVMLSFGMRVIGRWLPIIDLEGWQYFFTLCRLDALALGAMVCIVRNDSRMWQRVLNHQSWIFVGLGVLALGALAEAKWKGILGPFVYTWFAAMYAALIMLVLSKHPATVVLKLRPLRFIGTISYGLYLLHIPALGLVNGLTWSAQTNFLEQRPIGVSIGALCACFAIATTSFYLFEGPVLDRVKRRYKYDARPFSGN